PMYLRLGRSGDPAVHAVPPPFAIGRAITVRDGRDVTLLATGAITHAALEAADLLAGERVAARVVSVHTLKPLDTEAVRRACDETAVVVTVEEHSIVGGLGGAVAEAMADLGCAPRAFVRLALADGFAHEIGGREHLLRKAGLAPSDIARAARDALRKTGATAPASAVDGR
ncbi:MAG: transketolase C-terminal domain-containing protein, partial [Candidatus Limnocylindria bacterium]